MGAARTLRQASRLAAFEPLVRAGFVGRGLTYAVVGGLALALAAGAGGGRATDQQGAMALIAGSALGTAALAVIAVSGLAYALWKFVQAIAGFGPEGGGGTSLIDRVSNGGAGVLYLLFFAAAAHQVLAGSGSSGSQQRTASGVLGWPGGRLLVGVTGAVLIVICAIQAKQGLTGEFLEQWKRRELGRRMRPVVMALGRVGLVSRALVFAIVGWFLIRSAVEFNGAKAVGVDGALRSLARDSPWLLGVAAAGLLVFTLYSFAEARYRRL